MHGGLILQGFLASESQKRRTRLSFSQPVIKQKLQDTAEVKLDPLKKGWGEEPKRGLRVCRDLFGDYRDGSSDLQQQRQQRGVVMLSVTLGCVTQAGWMPLSTASCLNGEAYGCTRTSAYFMNI